MDLKSKIILGHVKSIVWFIVTWCMFCMGFLLLTIIVLSVWRGDKIEEPMGPDHNWVVPTAEEEWNEHIDSVLKSRLDNVVDSVNMNCGGEYHGKEGKSEYGEYEMSDKEYKEKYGEKEEFYY